MLHRYINVLAYIDTTTHAHTHTHIAHAHTCMAHAVSRTHMHEHEAHGTHMHEHEAHGTHMHEHEAHGTYSDSNQNQFYHGSLLRHTKSRRYINVFACTNTSTHTHVCMHTQIQVRHIVNIHTNTAILQERTWNQILSI
jgi:hypothetical protein